MISRRMLRLAAASLLVLTAACSRKAPGPEECHAFALRWARAEAPRIQDRRGRSQALVTEREITERTRVCLTTPFDRKLLQCVEEGGSPAWCIDQFRKRHSARLRSEE